MQTGPLQPAFVARITAEAGDMEALRRLLGGTGMLVAVILLLAVPLAILLRSAARRRRAARMGTAAAPRVDAWAEAGRRMREGA